MTHNSFQRPPLFVRDSVSDDGETIQIIDANGHAHTLHINDALLIIEAHLNAERYGEMEINTPEFEAIPA